MLVRAAPPGCRCFDSFGILTDADIEALSEAGYLVAGRYAQNLQAAEVDSLFERNMGLMLIGESREPGWVPSADTGKIDAEAILQAVARLKLPAGSTSWVDVEGPHQSAATLAADARAVIAHVDAFTTALVAGGGDPGAYLGYQTLLTSSEWYARPRLNRYGKSGSRLLDRTGLVVEPARGFSWVQVLPFDLQVPGCGVPIDAGILARDYEGGAVACIWAS